MASPVSMRSCACWAISAPWSQVNERRRCCERVVIEDAIASRTASAPCPASAGPLWTRGWPWLSMRGRCSSIREAGAALDQRPDRRAAQPDDEIAFPVARHGPIGGFGRALADQQLRTDELLAASTRPGPRHAQRSPGPQARGQLATQRAPTLHVERLIDRLMRDPHRVIIREVDREPVGDLLRAPRAGPAAVLAAPMTPPD